MNGFVWPSAEHSHDGVIEAYRMRCWSITSASRFDSFMLTDYGFLMMSTPTMTALLVPRTRETAEETIHPPLLRRHGILSISSVSTA